MTPDRMKEIAEAVEKATVGPWEDYKGYAVTKCGATRGPGYPPDPGSIASLDDGEYIENANSANDARFIALARTAVPELLAEVARLKAEASASYARGLEDAAKVVKARGIQACERGDTDYETGTWECSKANRGECNCFEFDELSDAIRALKEPSNG